MRQAGVRVIVRPPDADETRRPGEGPRSLVRRLSREKARSVARALRGSRDAIVIAADTIVVSPDGKAVLGKPANATEARRMLGRLAGREHSVFTGYSIELVDGRGKARRTLTRVVRSLVRMRRLSADDIALYVRTGEPMDKAGSYAAQGRGMALIESIVGSYANVVGLPICQLLMDLENEFGLRLFAG